MKKYISLAIALLCLGLFFACGRGYVPTPPADETPSMTKAEIWTEPESETTEEVFDGTEAATESTTMRISATTITASAAKTSAAAVMQHTAATAAAAVAEFVFSVPTTTRVTTTTTSKATTTTAKYIPSATTASTAASATIQQITADYEVMGQTLYQEKAVQALNGLRAEQGLAPMTPSAELMATTLEQANKMAAAQDCFHTGGFPPGFESVAVVPYFQPADTLGKMLTWHVSNFLQPGYENCGIAVVRRGNDLYCVMQGN